MQSLSSPILPGSTRPRFGAESPRPEQLPAVSEFAKRQIISRTERANRITEQLLDQIVARLKPGMTETEAKNIAIEIFQQNQVVKRWHAPYIRFGPNSILTFQDKAPSVKALQQDDIVFIDIGPVLEIDGSLIEGDVGKTVVFGSNPLFLKLKEQSEKLFQEGIRYWREKQPTGVALYEHLSKEAEKVGLQLHLDPAGHLIGSFPHKGWKEGLNHYPYTPEKGIWILEIQVRHPQLPYGAFFEDILQ